MILQQSSNLLKQKQLQNILLYVIVQSVCYQFYHHCIYDVSLKKVRLLTDLVLQLLKLSLLFFSHVCCCRDVKVTEVSTIFNFTT